MVGSRPCILSGQRTYIHPGTLKTARINARNGITSGIRVHIDAALIADGITVEEPPAARVIITRTQQVQARLDILVVAPLPPIPRIRIIRGDRADLRAPRFIGVTAQDVAATIQADTRAALGIEAIEE